VPQKPTPWRWTGSGTDQRPTEERYLMTPEQFETKMAVLCRRRAAEQQVVSHVT
jgi:hypothetical protein